MPDVYTTIQGDAWDAIAYRLWGDERLLLHLIWANPAYLDVVLFPAGIRLAVPERPSAVIRQELPPWR